MKHTLYYLWAIFFVGIFGSCTEEPIMQWNPEDSKLTISYSTVELISRTVPGVTDLNENKVNTVTCFLYLNNDGTSKGADIVKSVTIDVADASSPTAFTINFTEEELGKFTNATSMTLYAVANPSVELQNGTIAGIKKQQIVDSEFSIGEEPASFVMDGQLSINVELQTDGSLGYTFPENNDVLKLTRSAAKIMLHVHTNTVEDENKVEWIPQTDEMEVSFHNGVKYGYIDAGADICLPEDAAQIETDDNYYFSLENAIDFNTEMKVKPENSAVEYIQQGTPFYSYPQKWTDNPFDTTPYLMLVIPWKKKTETEENQEFVNYYYQIPISVQDKCLERNHFYKIFVDVKALGSLIPTEPITLNPSYIVVDWGKPADIVVGLKQYRYLVAEKNEYVMNNVNEFTIPFITSHKCKLQNVEVLMDDISVENVVKGKPQGKEMETYNSDHTKYTNGGVTPCSEDKYKELTITLDNTNSTVKIKHILDNDTNRDLPAAKRLYDYQPITIKFDIIHTDDNNYVEKFTVIQYPMMYVEAEKNEGGNIIKDYDKHQYDYYWNMWAGVDESVKYDRGWVFVNEINYFIKDDWRMVRGCYNGEGTGNKNPNMYIVTVTALDKDSPYMLGDPRTGQRLRDDQLYDNWNTNDAAAMYAVENGKERNLTYYNPTRTDKDSEKIIAPKFRMASSYSKLLTSYFPKKEKMRKRCATYQEQGYPAGRWRLPTVAELAYVQNLSVEGKIPHLYSEANHYWTATGSYTYYTGEGEEYNGQPCIVPNKKIDGHENEIGGVVRPFYDDWYWGDDKCNPHVFTWGDKPLQ